MGVQKDLRGLRFGKLLVMDYASKIKGRTAYLCKCDCENEKIVLSQSLTSGNTKSCGCLRKKTTSNNFKTYGLSKTRLYRIYRNMIQRCYNPKNTRYNRYGAKGIRICNEWLHDFKKFYDWAMNNGYKDDLSIDRINVNGNYEPSNCRWANNRTQQNNLSTNKNITFNNKTQTLSEWCKELNLNYHTTVCRLSRGWDIKKAFTTSTNKKEM